MTVSREATSTRVRVGGEDLSDVLHPVTVDLSTGGQRFDTAVLEYLQVPRGTLIDESESLALFGLAGQECEITIDVPGETQPQVVHWGSIAGQMLDLDGAGGKRSYISRLENFHFGLPLQGPRMRATPRTGPTGFGVWPEDVVFNPDYQGRCVGNCFQGVTIRGTFFIPPEQLTIASFGGAVSGDENVIELEPRTAEGFEVSFWSLTTATLILCDLCNPEEEFILNPDIEELQLLMAGTDATLRNHRQPLGKYLPEQLDLLLRPYGYDWNVELLEPGKRQIRVFARGRGQAGFVKLQAAGEKLDMDQSNAERVNLTGDVSSRCINRVEVVGDHVLVEGTWELVPAWPHFTDDAPDDDLIATNSEGDGPNPAWLTSDGINVSRTWRDWVLNEAGDYNGERKGIKQAFDLAPYLFGCVPKRRKFLPTLTLDTDGHPIGKTGGITVEVLDPFDLAGGEEGTWKDVSELGAECSTIRILDHECGIRFDGATPPDEILRAWIDDKTQMPKARVRITASIKADIRVGWLAGAPSPLDPWVNGELLDVGSRFKWRQIHSSSIYALKVASGVLKSSAVDDRSYCKLLAEQVLANWNQASIAGTLELTGCAYKPKAVLGKPIAGIAGRNIDFRTTAAGVRARYPIVVGVRYDFGAQMTTFTLDTFRGETLHA